MSHEQLQFLLIDVNNIMHVGQNGNPVVSWRSMEAHESPKNREGVSVMNSVDQDVLQVVM